MALQPTSSAQAPTQPAGVERKKPDYKVLRQALGVSAAHTTPKVPVFSWVKGVKDALIGPSTPSLQERRGAGDFLKPGHTDDVLRGTVITDLGGGFEARRIDSIKAVLADESQEVSFEDLEELKGLNEKIAKAFREPDSLGELQKKFGIDTRAGLKDKDYDIFEKFFLPLADIKIETIDGAKDYLTQLLVSAQGYRNFLEEGVKRKGKGLPSVNAAFPILFNGEKYAVTKTKSGLVLQPWADWNASKQTGVFIPDDPNKDIIFGEGVSAEVVDLAEATLKGYGLPLSRVDEANRVITGRKKFSDFQQIYNFDKRIRRNLNQILSYIGTPSFLRHVQSAKVYYNDKQMSIKDALRLVRQREPVNIAMMQEYDKGKLEAAVGYREGVFNAGVTKEDGQPFAALPNTASIYSETYIWPAENKDAGKKEVAILSLPAPSLDNPAQPHFDHYMQNGRLNTDKYEAEMAVLAKMVVGAFIDNQATARGGKGLDRLLISRYGMGAFLEGVTNPEDKEKARDIYFKTLVAEIKANAPKLKGKKIMIADKQPFYKDDVDKKVVGPLKDIASREEFEVGFLPGAITATARDGDLIVNAWDPHSIPGNGNDGDGSFDGWMGRATGVGAVQNAHLNVVLQDPAHFAAIS